MSSIHTPCYYAVTDTVDTPPFRSEIREGRLFFDGEEVVCGAGESVGGYGERLDEYSGSTVRRLLGGRYDPQQFDRDTALDRDGTITLSAADIEETSLLRWNGSDLSGAERTYGVRVVSSKLSGGALVIQLGKGNRNRGAGKERHRALTDALATGPAQQESDTTSERSNQDTADTTTEQSQQDTAQTQGTDTPVDDAASGNADETNAPTATTEHATSDDTMAQQRCLTCDAQIDPTVNFCPSCGTESPLAGHESTPPTERTASRKEQSHADADMSERTEITAVADRIEQRTNSATARRLCRTLSDPDASTAEIESALESAVDELESVTAVKEAVKPAERRSTAEAFETIKRDLDGQRNQLSEAVFPLVDRLIDAKRDLDAQEDQHGEMRADVQAICEHATADSFSFRERELHRRVGELKTALDNGELTITEPTTSLAAVVEELDQEIRPSSGLSRELLGTLRQPANESAAKATIRDSIDVLDDYAETREMLADISVDDVRMRLESLDRELRDHDSPTHSQLANRVRELEAMIDDADAVDDIQLFAIYQEISFYDRTLLPQLARVPSGGDGTANNQLPETVRDRIEEIETEYVSVRTDHNHSIPNHFLGLAENLLADAQQRADADQAEGILLAADAVLDHVEELYQRNEYSVMLRRLRG